MSRLLSAWCYVGIDFPSIFPSVHLSMNPSTFVSALMFKLFPMDYTLMILGISLHLEMTTQTAVSIFDRPVFHGSLTLYICVIPSFDPNVQVHFSSTTKATVTILGIGLHSGMKTQIAVLIFDLYLYFMVHRLCKCIDLTFKILLPRRHNIAFNWWNSCYYIYLCIHLPVFFTVRATAFKQKEHSYTCNVLLCALCFKVVWYSYM